MDSLPIKLSGKPQLIRDQTMVEVMKIMVTSFKRSHAGTAELSAPDPAAGHCQSMPPLKCYKVASRNSWDYLLLSCMTGIRNRELAAQLT